MRARSVRRQLDVDRSQRSARGRGGASCRGSGRDRRLVPAPTRVASCAGVIPFSSAISLTFAASARFASRFSPVNRGPLRRKSSSSSSSSDVNRPARNPRPSGEYGHESDPELAAGRQDLGLGVAAPQRVLRLHGGDRVHGVRAADRLRRRLAQADVADLALLDQRRHRSHGFFDGHLGVDAMLVVEVDVVGPEPLERPFDRPAHVRSGAVLRPDARHVAWDRVIHAATELRRDHVLVAVPLIARPTSSSLVSGP